MCAAVSPVKLARLRKRRDFTALSRNGAKIVRPAFVLIARRRDDDPDAEPRIGFTASRKIGKAVMRNRAKRRMRALAECVLGRQGRAIPGWDYVLIGRRDAVLKRSFAAMIEDLRCAAPSRRRAASPPSQSSAVKPPHATR